ncbi:hypothetical protein U1872_06605 [Sphingomonas sp. RB3P16]|uniref:hypothetical protein n=1 Tax=Parasphingomonas frigoris TaxID=3096163 RepID=UPI002FC6DDDC
MARLPLDAPIDAAAEHGEVILDGPEGLAASLTPAAAKRSARRIAKAADIAESEPHAETP